MLLESQNFINELLLKISQSSISDNTQNISDACSDDVDQHSGIWDEQESGDAAADAGVDDEQQDQSSGEAVRVLAKVLSSGYVELLFGTKLSKHCFVKK